MDVLVTALVMILCLIAEAFFSGSEIGVISADRMKLRHRAAKGSRGAKLALSMLEKPEWLLSTTLVGTNIAVVTNTTMATGLMISLFGKEYSWLAIILVAPLIWIFGEIVSKGIFQQRADSLTPKAIFVLRAASYVFYPILIVFSVLTRILARLAGGEQRNPFTLREEIVTLMEMSATGGDIEPAEQKMIRNVFNFGETTADAVMVPLIDVVGVEQGASCKDAVTLAVDKAHKRLPVYDKRVDRIVGTLNALDLLREDETQPIKPFAQPARYIPGSKRVDDLLMEFRREGDKMAVIVDEFGGAEGIIMIEDILEEVVGEIEDEFDQTEAAQQWVRKQGERHYLISARIELDMLEEKLGIALPEGDYETLAGFLVELAHEIPAPGAVIPYRKYTFTIERATEQAIKEIRVRW